MTMRPNLAPVLADSGLRVAEPGPADPAALPPLDAVDTLAPKTLPAFIAPAAALQALRWRLGLGRKRPHRGASARR